MNLHQIKARLEQQLQRVNEMLQLQEALELQFDGLVPTPKRKKKVVGLQEAVALSTERLQRGKEYTAHEVSALLPAAFSNAARSSVANALIRLADKGRCVRAVGHRGKSITFSLL